MFICFMYSLTVQEIVDTDLLDKKYNEEEAKVGGAPFFNNF